MHPTNATLPVINGLRPHIIPHVQWITRRWFSHTPLWYYHRPEPMPRLALSKQFYREVDPDLRTLCKSLHERGIQTGPSCQGHFYSREHFMRIWEQMRKEEDAICNDGLEVTNSETNDSCLFQDAHFELPWSDFEDFYDEIAAHQNAGYLAVVTNGHSSLPVRLMRGTIQSHAFSLTLDTFMSDELRAPLIHIRVRSKDPDDRRRAWDEIGELLDHLWR